MDDISKLIQEAKPLYFKRKKRRHQMRGIAGALGCFLIAYMTFMPFSGNYKENLDSFYAYLYDDESFEQLLADASKNMNETVLLDEYGLMAVL